MTTTKNKKLASYSINKNVVAKFNEIAERLGSNKSKVIQLLIETWIKKNEKNEI